MRRNVAKQEKMANARFLLASAGVLGRANRLLRAVERVWTGFYLVERG